MTLTRRQRKILDFVREFSERRGYAPTLHEIGKHFGLRSPATVHKHLRNLEERGALKRRWNHSRAIEILPEEGTARAYHLPLVGAMEAGRPLELMSAEETVPVPAGLVGEGRTYVLRVRGDGFREALVRSGDLVVIEEKDDVADGALMLVLLRGNEPAFRTARRGDGKLTFEPLTQAAVAPLPALAPPPGFALGDPVEARARGRVLGVLRKY